MPRKTTAIADGDIAKAAYWRAAMPELSLEKLAVELNLKSSVTLKKRLDEAINRKWIANDWVFKGTLGRLSEILPEMEDKRLHAKITQLCGTANLPRLTVVPAWPPERNASSLTNEAIDEINMRLVAHAAAKIFIERIPDMKVIGLSYGRTLQKMVDALEHFSTDVQNVLKNNTSDISRIIVTICGSLSFPFDDKRHSNWLECSASYLTNRLARILGTDKCQRRFLETPAYVPPAFLRLFSNDKTIKSKLDTIAKKLSPGDELQIARAFVEAIPIYHDIFVNGQESAVEKLDTVITSVGDLETGFGSLEKGEAAPPLLGDEEKEKLLKEAVGDIAGRYLTKNGETGKVNSTISKVNDRIFGLTLEDLEKIAQREPGVIVIASSQKKARVIAALLNHQKTAKVISELVISGDIAKELAK
ncbi:MAG: sugar-binding domain-containing protein [Sedimentisphaerales bacterium]